MYLGENCRWVPLVFAATATRTNKKTVALDWQTTTLHVHHALLYISLPTTM